ncbi:hypothetical protein [Paraburkholderia sp. RL17-373-BIF-A]|uniref:hypothetical protein n=1 Tax=Paraburkholderia sp. RL17-373-BIF-A TaxID=3031629 RepID=UPI0038B6DEA6
MSDLQLFSATERDHALKIASEGNFLDGVFRVERYNHRPVDTTPGFSLSSGAIVLSDIYPNKTPQEINEAIAQVRRLNQDARAYVSAAFDKRPDCEALERKLLEDNPGFSQVTYDLVINDAFVTQSTEFARR